MWEEGRETGRRVVALGVALALTALVLDVALSGEAGLLFDVCFVALSVAVALAVRPSDFFVAGVLPPLVMAGTFLLAALTEPDRVAHPDDGVVQATISGLSHHSVALVTGYGLCLGVLLVRQRVLAARQADPSEETPSRV